MALPSFFVFDNACEKLYHIFMRRFFGKIEGNYAILEEDEFVHLRTVLRTKIGDEIIIFDGSPVEYVCKIENMSKSQAYCRVLSSKKCDGLPKKNLVLFQALTKRDKLELILQKAVEIGISKMQTFDCEYCNAKSSENKNDRLEKIVISACKQCERSVPMKIGENLSFENLQIELNKFLNLPESIVIFANERSQNAFDFSLLKEFKNIAIIVGPEGGFSVKEKEVLEKICTSVSLGERILRSETASIILCGIASILGGN